MKPHRLFFCFAGLFFALFSRVYAAEPDFRAMWVSTVYNLDYPSQQGLSAGELAKEADGLLDLAEHCGLNALILQVRPCADSLYPSEIFPWSEYLSGTQGTAPADGFDPLGYFIEKGHARGIEIHAWCNPYRVTRKAASDKASALALLCESHPARQNPDLVVFHSDGCLYFDPGNPQARDIILQGMLEILEKYPVDGLHLDDYFYPGSEFEDADTFARYGASFDSVGDFRRACVTQFIGDLYRQAKALRPQVQIGVSPFGIWANASQNPDGSDTVGSQSYYDHYADSRGWVLSGIVDYIAPQLYWPTGSREGEYSELLRWWCETTRDTGVRLYIGLGAYRLTEAEPGSPWEGTAEIESQINQLCQSGADGFLLFRAGSIRQAPDLARLLARRYSPENASLPSLSLSVTRPSHTTRTSLASFYCTGVSDPAADLTVNGQSIQTRSESGYFGTLLTLSYGKNTFIFQNAELEQRLVLYRLPPSAAFSNQYPSAQTRLPPDEITLSCTAPQGSRVSAWYGGTCIPLSPESPTQFTAALPQDVRPETPSPVLYTAETHGFVRVSYSSGTLGLLDDSETLAFRVSSPRADLYFSTETGEGAGGFLADGMTGAARGIDNGFLCADGLGYLPLSDAELLNTDAVKPFAMTSVLSEETQEEHTLRFFFDGTPAASCRFEDGSLIVSVQPVKLALLFENPIFSSVTLDETSGGIQYTLTLRSDIAIDGYRLLPCDDGFTLHLKKHRTVEGPLPLSGIHILLDAGHGGDAYGAVGALPEWPEKRLNLSCALALKEALTQAGATVTLTRSDDTDVALQDRLSQSCQSLPDVFLSLHSNSAADDADISRLSGVGLYAKSTLAAPLAQCISEELSALGRTPQLHTDSNLYLCRAEWSLSLLLENEYITSPFGLETLLSEEEQAAFCTAVTEGICAYYAQ